MLILKVMETRFYDINAFISLSIIITSEGKLKLILFRRLNCLHSEIVLTLEIKM